jgi:hypothetical protein
LIKQQTSYARDLDGASNIIELEKMLVIKRKIIQIFESYPEYNFQEYPETDVLRIS